MIRFCEWKERHLQENQENKDNLQMSPYNKFLIGQRLQKLSPSLPELINISLSLPHISSLSFWRFTISCKQYFH